MPNIKKGDLLYKGVDKSVPSFGSVSKPGEKLMKYYFCGMLNEAEILKLLLPEFLIEHFDIVKFTEVNKILHIYFEEKSTIPQEFSALMLQSKGFLPERMTTDFAEFLKKISRY